MGFFLFNSHENESSNFKPGRNFSICASQKLCLFWSIQFYCGGKRNRKLITITLIIIITIICILGSVLDSGTCFWILGSVIWIQGCVFEFWEVLWILGSVSVSGKCAPAFC